MKVLVVTTSYPSVRAPHNGVFIREHALALKRRGMNVTVLAPRVFAQDPALLDDDGIAVHRFGFWSRDKLLTEYDGIPVARMATYLASGIAAATRLIRREQPDVVHGHWAIPTGLIGVVASQLAGGRPTVVTAHRKDLEVALSGSHVARALAQHTLNRADRVVAVSHALQGTIAREFSTDAARIDVAPMGVDTQLFKPGDRDAARDRLGIERSTRLALFVGGLMPVKGVRDLVEAMPAVLPGDESVQLVLAGHGPLATELVERAEQLGQSSRVRLLGPVDHDRLPMWMDAADVLVLPSESEGLPVCLMEAAAMGLPMIATDVGGSAEVVALDERNTLIEPHDVVGLVEALSRALERPYDPHRASFLAPGSRFTLDGAMDHLAWLYTRLAESGGKW